MDDAIDFGNLELAEQRVTVDGKPYVLREATEDVACKVQNARIREMSLGADGKPTALRNVADADPYFLSLCLFEDNGKGKVPVPLQTIRAWPARVVKPLVALAKKISRMEDEAPPDGKAVQAPPREPVEKNS